MKVLIVEDEAPAAEKLTRYLHKYDKNIEVINRLDTVKDTSTWLKEHQQELDLIFMDIQLIDGKSFEIFDQVDINKPIIFTTAFDEYALDAFKVNSIDYLLKPITFDDLSDAIEKLGRMKDSLAEEKEASLDINKVLHQLQKKTYKNRFMVKLGDHIKSITSDGIALFYAEGRSVYLYTKENRKFIIDFKLEELEDMLDPVNFIRLNRSFIVNISGIDDVVVYSNSRLKITPTIDFDKEIIVSREKVSVFKEWFSGA